MKMQKQILLANLYLLYTKSTAREFQLINKKIEKEKALNQAKEVYQRNQLSKSNLGNHKQKKLSLYKRKNQ